MRERKFIKGQPLKEPLDAIAAALRGDWMFLHGRPKHPSIIMSMQVWTVTKLARAGRLYLAIPNPHHPDHKETE